MRFGNTSYLHDKLPHLLAWNFIFGWLFWAFKVKEKKVFKTRILISTCLIACSFLTFISTNALYGEARFFWFVFFGMVAIWIDKIKVPHIIGHYNNLIGQATFYIFLWHYPSFGINARIGSILGQSHIVEHPVILLLSGLIYPILLWAGVNALRRTYRRIKIQKVLSA
jgi:hypothetical protein